MAKSKTPKENSRLSWDQIWSRDHQIWSKENSRLSWFTAAPASRRQKVVAAFETLELLPAHITTGSQLFASSVYKTTRVTALASVLAVSSASITILSFVLSETAGSRSRRGRERILVPQTSYKNVRTNFEVLSSNSSAAEEVQTILASSDTASNLMMELVRAINVANFSSDNVFTGGAAPEVGAVLKLSPGSVEAGAAPTTVAAVRVISKGERMLSTVMGWLQIMVLLGVVMG